jgi:TolB protein
MKWTTLLVLPILFSLALPSIAEEKIHIFIGGPGKNKIPIALPKPLSTSKASVEYYEVLKQDLELSGWVEIIDPNAYIEPQGVGVRLGEFRFPDWEITNATALAKTKLTIEDDTIATEVWVYDVAGAKKLSGKAFRAEPEKLRMLAHRAASEIIMQITGQSVPFNTRFAAVGTQTGNKELYLMDFSGENLIRLTRNKSINIKPSWNPEGNKITFTSYLNGTPDLYMIDLSLKKIRRLSSRSGINIGASWHPNGSSIALTLAPRGNSDIYQISGISGKIEKRLTRHHGIDTAPAYSPDGSKIAYVSERAGGAQIYVMNADGSGNKRLTFDGQENTDPAWSPDGTKIAFVSRQKNFDVFVVNSNGRGLRRITQDMGNNEDPSWSYDGNYIAFSSTRTSSAHIWMSTSDGSHQVQLSKGKGGFTNPTWSPPISW